MTSFAWASPFTLETGPGIDTSLDHDSLKSMFTRFLRLPAPGAETFFLWGPRQTGKSTLVRTAYPDAFWVDLLKSDDYRRYAAKPETLRQEVLALEAGTQVVIDEVQKV